MKAVLLYAVPLVASLALGAVLGSIGSPPPPPPPSPASPNIDTTIPPPAPSAALSAIPDADLPSHYTSATGKERDLIARFWSRADPAAFLTFLSSSDPPFFSDPSHALYLFETWAARDFDSAFQASLDLSPFNPLRHHIQHSVAAKKFESDPAAAVAALDHIWANNGSTHSVVIPFLDSPHTSLTHLAALPRTDVAALAIARCLAEWATTDPAAALTWAQQNGAPTFQIIATAWRDEPRAAVDLLSTLTSPRARSKAAANLAVKHFHVGSPEISVALIDTYLDGWTRSDTARRLAERIAAKNPQRATEIGLTHDSPAARAAAITASLSRFDRDAPRSLDLWLASLPDTPSTKLIRSTVKEIRTPPAPPADPPPPPGSSLPR